MHCHRLRHQRRQQLPLKSASEIGDILLPGKLQPRVANALRCEVVIMPRYIDWEVAMVRKTNDVNGRRLGSNLVGLINWSWS